MSGEALASDQEGALRSLEQFIHMGQSNEPALQGKQFESLRQSEIYRALLAEMAKNRTPVADSHEAFQLPEAGLIPEDVDYDSATTQFYVTSVLKQEILSLDKNG